MIVHDFDVLGALRGPTETDTEQVVHTDTVLALSASLQRLQSIARRNA
jgi:hypothetical protein